jgi:23S rRNA (cytosine1962-C5)-methyltransferase
VFEVNLLHGQKTAFFLDQRDNRLRIRSWAKERTVLNLFGYTGGFSVYAGAGGAREVTTVDSADAAIKTSNRNWKKNGFEESRHHGITADAFEFLEEAKKEKKYWDLVIVDPPSFAPGKHHIEKAKGAYLSVLVSALQVTSSHGIFAASSCSSHISPALFLEICEEAVSKAKRRATVLGIYGQPEDHPFPLACTELQYLKFVLLCIE